jgi:hypothetical protein
MSYQLLASQDTVQVFSPTLVSDALVCTIASSPSGSILIRTITQQEFTAEGGASGSGVSLLNSLSDAVEQILGEGIAVAASGTQLVDPASGLLYDAVVFTVAYPQGSGGQAQITATVEVPMTTLTADTQFGSFLTGGSAQQMILDTYNHLQTLAGG